MTTDLRPLLWAVPLIALGGCTRESRSTRRPDREPVAQGVVVDAAPIMKFDATGWGGIAWAATPDEAKAALTAAGHEFKAEEQRAYFANPAPGTAMHTNGLFLKFDRPPLKGSVNFESSKLENISFTSQKPFTREQALAEQAKLVQRWGTPTERGGSPEAPMLRWKNATTILESHISQNQDPNAWSHLEWWLPVPIDGGP